MGEGKGWTLGIFDFQNNPTPFLEQTHSCFYLFVFSINLLAFYHECRPLIGYATHVLFCDR